MPTLTQDKPRSFSMGVAHNFKVDPATGRLTDLQLMAAGREAKGHGVYCDAKTLETAKAAIAERGGRLKAYRTHDHAGPTTWYGEEGSELDIIGFFSSIDVKGEQLVAGAYEFYDSFKTAQPDLYARMLEIATKTPELIALSVEIWGYAVFVAKDGTEYSQRPEDTELLYDGMPALRVTDMWAAAFVSDGALTDGLFAKFSARFGNILKKMFAAEQTPVNTPAVATEPVAQTAPAASGAASATLPPPGLNTKPGANATLNSNPSNQMPLSIAELKKTFGADQARFDLAVKLVSENPDLTIEALSVKVVEAAQVTLAAKVTDLTAQLDTASKTVTNLTAERDAWKGKFEAIKNSGGEAPLDLNVGDKNKPAEGELTGAARVGAAFTAQLKKPGTN